MFIPKKSKTFDVLHQQAEMCEKAAQLFHKLANNWNQLKPISGQLEELEKQADELMHIVGEELEKTFILPFDKEDVKALADSLDDIIDNIEQTANRINIYKIPKSNEQIKDFADLIVKAVKQIHQGILMIKEHKLALKEFVLCYKELHNIENQGDKLHRKILESLMGPKKQNLNSSDILLVFKWKEIFQTLEDTLDKCEDVAVIFDRLRIKYG